MVTSNRTAVPPVPTISQYPLPSPSLAEPRWYVAYTSARHEKAELARLRAEHLTSSPVPLPNSEIMRIRSILQDQFRAGPIPISLPASESASKSVPWPAGRGR